ncbi:MAG: hypothetical protein F4W92_06745 [Gammaproteobacteria bacterium]|nr:hypothetical protein [Gammaproteobacteria bacterium]
MKSWVQIFCLAIVGMVLMAATASAQSSSRGNWRWQEPSITDIRDRSTETFKLLDEDENGSITLEEIDVESLSEEETAELSNEELRARRQRSSLASSMFLRWNEDMDAFDISDTNGDGFMTREEFENRRATLRTHMLEEGIAVYDTDRNGSVELTEFNAKLEDLEDIDTDGNGTLSRAELSKIEDREVIRSVRVSQYRNWESRRWDSRGGSRSSGESQQRRGSSR